VTYLARYHAGEYVAVWEELQSLGPAVRDEPHFSQAQAVAAETMRRVRRDCESLASRLRAMGYNFGKYPDGSRRSYNPPPITPPSKAIRDDCSELETQAGPLPISLVAFWHEVGAVDFVGMQRGWPSGLDPLVVDPPEGALSFLFDLEGQEADPEGATFFAGLAPDELHKDNVSGGDPFGVNLPNPSADFKFQNEQHGLLFVPYLRVAILRWGGFPGLDGMAAPFEPLSGLVEGLEPF